MVCGKSRRWRHGDHHVRDDLRHGIQNKKAQKSAPKGAFLLVLWRARRYANTNCLALKDAILSAPVRISNVVTKQPAYRRKQNRKLKP